MAVGSPRHGIGISCVNFPGSPLLMVTKWQPQLEASHSLTQPHAKAESKEVSKRKHILPCISLFFPEASKNLNLLASLIDQKN